MKLSLVVLLSNIFVVKSQQPEVITDPAIPTILFNSEIIVTPLCLTDWDPEGEHYSGSINYSDKNETCDRWSDFYPNVPHSLINEGNKCRNYLEPKGPKCLVKGVVKLCPIPKCKCYSPFICVGPTAVNFVKRTVDQAEKVCHNYGSPGLLKIRSFVHNEFVRKFLEKKPGIYWLGYSILELVISVNLIQEFTYLEPMWGLMYGYTNFHPTDKFEFLPSDNITERVCVVLDNRKPSQTLYWKFDYCHAKHLTLCDFSTEGYDIFRDSENSFDKCAPPSFTLWSGRYIGRHNKTKSGFPCQSWDTDYPNYIGNIIREQAIKYDSMPNHNYCRSIKSGFPVCMRDYPGGDFELCDIPSCVNIAPFGKAYQSSTKEFYGADLAIDGVIINGERTCSRTLNDHHQWWEIELPDRVYVTNIVVISKHVDETAYNHITIFIRNKNIPFTYSSHCVTDSLWISSNEPRFFKCEMWGQLIRIEISDEVSGPLILCEVEIYILASTDECYSCKEFRLDYQGTLQYPKNGIQKCSSWELVVKKFIADDTVVHFPEGTINKNEFQISSSRNYLKHINTFFSLLKNYCRFIWIKGESKPTFPVCPGNNLNLIPCETPPICEEKLYHMSCLIDNFGDNYRGKINITTSGEPCIRWLDVINEDPSLLKLYPFLINEEDFCRNPDHHPEGPWCFVNLETFRKETCNVPLCVNMALANSTIETVILGSDQQSWLWDKDERSFYTNNYVTLIPERTTPAQIIFIFKYPIKLRQVGITPFYKPNIMREGNLNKFSKLSVQTGYTVKDVEGGKNICTEMLLSVKVETFYLQCVTLASVVKISAFDASDDLEISEIKLLARYTYRSCINRKDQSLSRQMKLCDDIRNLNLWKVTDSSKDRCSMWKNFHPLVLVDDDKYCDNIPLRKRVKNRYLTEHCGFDICMNDINILCKTSKYGEDYLGNHSVTSIGYPCDKWSNHKENITDNPWLVYDENYCRNPNKDKGGPWCFIIHETLTWAYCKVPSCINIAAFGSVSISSVKTAENLFCLEEPFGTNYIGTRNYTINGWCRPWSKDINPLFRNIDHNFCRNFEYKDKPWCFVNSLQEEWEYCDIPLCANYDQGDLFSASKAIDKILTQSYEYCAVSKSQSKKDTYITWDWSISEVARIVGIRLYPAKQYMEDFRGLNVLLYNTGFRETVICKMQNRAARLPFTDIPCIYKANKVMTALRVGQNLLKGSVTLTLCQVEIFISGETKDCYNFLKGIDFMGLRSITKSGKVCTKWKNHKISREYHFPEGPGSDPDVLEMVKNYCRNPVLKSLPSGNQPYCFTDYTNTVEPCDVPACTDDGFAVTMVKPDSARLNKSFVLLCVANVVGFIPITIVWLKGDNIPITKSGTFDITQINSSASELNIQFLSQSMTTIICLATIGSYYASSVYTYSAMPECKTCWTKIKKYCSVICGMFDPPVTQPLYKDCQMTCVLETVNATVQCIETHGLLMWEPVDICTYKPMITENMVYKEERKVPSSKDFDGIKDKALQFPEYLIIFFIFMLVFILSLIICSIYSKTLRIIFK